MQYTKLGVNRLFNCCGSHLMQCNLIMNRWVIDKQHHPRNRYGQVKKTIQTDKIF